MSRCWMLVALLPLGWPAAVAGQAPAEPPANPENIAAALRLTQAAAAAYQIRVGKDDTPPLELQREPVLRWSNPAQGEVHGNVFLWTRGGRPLVVGSLYKWFTPHTHMSNEFQSLAEGPVAASFPGKPDWVSSGAGVKFADVRGAPAPAEQESQRLLQVKQLARGFAGSKVERDDPKEVELRLLPQPLHRYAVVKDGVQSGALFAFVQGTDPEIFLLIEARGESPAKARWQFAAARMNSVEVRLRHDDRQVWSAPTMPWGEVHGHRHAYTNFGFNEIPAFLRDAAKPRP